MGSCFCRNGLESLIDSIEIIGNSLYIDFNRDYSTKMVNDESVYHFIWLKFNKIANDTWSFVYNNIFSTAAENLPIEPIVDLKKGVYIEVKPPIDKECRWLFSGLTNGNSTFIFELKSIQGLDMPYFEKVYYSHHSLYNLKTVDEPKTIRNTVREQENLDECQLDDSGAPSKKNSNQISVDVPVTLFGFNRTAKMIKCRKRTQKLRAGEYGEEREGTGGQLEGKVRLVTTQDWAMDGNIQSIEFKALEVVKEDPKRGLEKFLKVVEYIERNYKCLSLSLSVVYLPYTNSFSICPNGNRRTCAIVKVTRTGHDDCYILEVGRPDEWSVSTLFIRPIGTLDIETFEIILENVLNQLVENNGHWDQDFLQQFISFNYDIAKHISVQTIAQWGERLVERMN